jgi:hypothetical protein
MAITMYSGFVPVCLQSLGGLKTVLQKAEEHATAQCTARGFWDTELNPTPPRRRVEAAADGTAPA